MAVMIKDKEYQVRELIIEDVEHFSRILDEIDFKLSDFTKKIETEKTVTERDLQRYGAEVVMEMVTYVARNYHKASDLISAWMGSLIDVKGPLFKKMPLSALPAIFKELGEQTDLLDFFKQATG